MIDLSQLEISEYVTTVYPSDNIFSELGNNTYDYKDLISELIDNSVVARRSNVPLNVEIEISINSQGEPQQFIIRDNGGGIPLEKMGNAITPAGIQTRNSLNEHGLGMKQAISALGKLEYLATKTEGEPKARVVREFKFGPITTYHVPMEQEAGTEICIADLKPIVNVNPTSITRSLVPYLGARYRRFLAPENKVLNLNITLKALNTHEILYKWSIDECKQIYFHPSTRTNKPVIFKHPLSGSNWNALLTFGYAPKSEGEYTELGIPTPNRFHPYRVSLSTQGLDIILHNRVILFHQLPEIELASRHPDYNDVRGEIELISGFATAITKNSIIWDKNFKECLEMIKAILKGEEVGPEGRKKDYLTRKTYPEEIPEKLLRDRLVEYLANNPMNKRSNIKREYVIQGIEGYIDILADEEAWEIKVDQANALDVYQLFMYMDLGNMQKGFLVARSFTTGAQVAVEHILNTYGKEIVIAPRDRFPINHPASDTERDEYY